jgi:hypothetical protein
LVSDLKRKLAAIVSKEPSDIRLIFENIVAQDEMSLKAQRIGNHDVVSMV